MVSSAAPIAYSTLAVGDGDVVLVKCPGSISDETAERLREHAERTFPGHKVLVLGNGIDVLKVPGDERLARIEAKLDTLLGAWADVDDVDVPECDVDGRPEDRPL